MLSRIAWSCFVAVWLFPGVPAFSADSTTEPEGEPSERASEAVDFAQDVRPILSDHCYACHGPDEKDRQAGLRLDTAEGIASVTDSGEDSELIRRVRSDDAYEVMPPPEFNKPLSAQQQQILASWAASGGHFQRHWAFVPPEKVEVPDSADHPIDHFIDRAIEDKGLQPNGPAGDSALLRRVCLDLTGLPPNRDQIERVQSGQLKYEALVDELLQSPEFGKHFGRYWLDLVRYADTHGLHLDNYREMWPYRDWVIDAINDNMPFDQFVTEQLAGDLLPDATLAQQVASGFNRLNVTTSEGGSIYEEVFARNVIDRTDAFGTIFLGLTTQCAVCHDHKFDPITQKDYYSLSAFFNSLDGRALDDNREDPPPVVTVPSDEQRQRLAEFDRELASLREEMAGDIASVDAAQRAWEQSIQSAGEGERHDRVEPLMPRSAKSKAGADLSIEQDGTVRLGGEIAATDTHTLVAPLGNTLAGGRWQTLKLEAFPDEATGRVGVSENGNVVLTEITVETHATGSEADPDGGWMPLPIRFAVADIEQEGGPFAVSYAIDQKRDDASGWAVNGQGPKGGRKAWFQIPDLAERIEAGDDQIRVRLDYRSKYAKHQFRAVRLSVSELPPAVSAENRVALGTLHSVGPFPVESVNPGFGRSFASQQDPFDADQEFPYRGQSYRWEPRPDWGPVDVIELPTDGDHVSVNLLHQGLEAPQPVTIDLLVGTSGGHVVFLNSKRIGESRQIDQLQPLQSVYKLELKKGHNDLYLKAVGDRRGDQLTYAFRSPAIELPDAVVRLARTSREERSTAQEESLRKYFREVQCVHPDWLALKDAMRGTEKAKSDLQDSLPTTLVWKELDEPREAKILIRGQYDQPGETVPRATPEFLPPMPEDAPSDRLGLARWLVDPANPLTARVAVNRFWQIVFGTGLVKSSEDFGNQGAAPSHPELLDYLAVDFREHGWDVKRLVRQMVTSRAYRRDAAVSQSAITLDPGNRFYARGPRHRLDAEVLRNQALALSGLLSDAAGGPSVKPPQPKGLWYAVGYTRSNTANFQADTDPSKVYRRSVYIFWKRTSAPPQMSTFDAPSRESCTARRERTNTPLQALVLMNETQYLQAAKHLAGRALTECPSSELSERVAWLFQTVTARLPNETELEELSQLLRDLLDHYDQQEAAAEALLAVDPARIDGATPAQQAAWMVVASTLLNLDEVINN
ncbi:DUF1553 domain-containing protein [Roseiconus nitratireducens]|uniref:DUF1553 domain-containing protein n=1 Tax=Roseiconus nitratireducens TaxID=2605748 RepID=A0A5M6D7T3_9BACT|nr:PSD1 and planctomycete cytochrome C domain-containing protein [Roseiconus nitratireducens]KAA5542550.1 DUF1553 domain-containing protein [Roseiconus nitratireducens]